MPNRFDVIAAEAAELTRSELDGELARITSLSESTLDKLLPKKSDKELFAELMAIVNASSSRNKKAVEVKENIDRFAGIIVKLLELV